MGYFRLDGSNEVFGFYRQLSRPIKQGRKKLGIVCVLYAKALDGTNYDKWTWVKCARVITNNNTKLLCHLDNKNAGLASFKSLVIHNDKKGLVARGPATVYSIGSIINTCVTSSIYVIMNK